jgi:hypothetical protein
VPKRTRKAARPASLSWEFDRDIPTHDFFEDIPLTDLSNLEQAVDGFVYWMEEDRFLTWEAVMREEQGLRLTARHKEALEELLSFNDEEDDQILCIDEIPRPSEPWYAILNKVVPHLLIEPYKTFDIHNDVIVDGWKQLMSVLREHAEGLSLPSGAKWPEEVVPVELRHRLWLQYCFNDLGGLGQTVELTLEDAEEHWRIDWFVDHLREHKESVEFLGLTLQSLMAKLILPEKDQPIFAKLLREKLGLHSDQARLADHV